MKQGERSQVLRPLFSGPLSSSRMLPLNLLKSQGKGIRLECHVEGHKWSRYASELSNMKWKAEVLPEAGRRKVLCFLFKNVPPVVRQRVSVPS